MKISVFFSCKVVLCKRANSLIRQGSPRGYPQEQDKARSSVYHKLPGTLARGSGSPYIHSSQDSTCISRNSDSTDISFACHQSISRYHSNVPEEKNEGICMKSPRSQMKKQFFSIACPPDRRFPSPTAVFGTR